MVDLGGSPWGGADDAEPAELDPTGANAGIHAPLITDPPPEGGGSLVPYPRFADPSHPGTSYSVDGMPVPVDYFMQLVDFTFHGSLGLAEANARASRARFRNYEVAAVGEFGKQDFGDDLDAAKSYAQEMGLREVTANWIVNDWSFSLVAPSPQNPQNIVPLPSDLRDRVAGKVNNPATDCGEFIKKVLDEAAQIKHYKKGFYDDPLAVFDRIQRQGGFQLKVTTDPK